MDNTADIQTVEVTSYDKETGQMELIAKLAAKRLSEHYPNHVWMVGWAPGMALVIKHMLGDNRYGFTVDVPRAHSISHLEKLIVNAGGELLERLGFARGAWNGDMPTHTYEGVRAGHEMPTFDAPAANSGIILNGG